MGGILALAVVFCGTAVHAQDDGGKDGGPDPWSLTPSFNNALVFKSSDGSHTFKLGGRIHLDTAFFSPDSDNEAAFGDTADGVEFRRTRLLFEGTLWKQFSYRMQYDFAGSNTSNRPAFKDVYGAMKGVGMLGTVKAGHFKEPFGLEELTSSKYITFMERSLTSVFTPARNVGVAAGNHFNDQHGTWAAGVFRNTNDATGFGTGDGDYSLTGRMTLLPTYEVEGKKLIHMGAAVSYQGAPGNSQRYRQRPSAHLAPRLTDTGTLRVNSDCRVGVELASVWGPLSVQGEAMSMWAHGVKGQEDFRSLGGYLMASYFFTGESRPYDTKKGVFKRVKPTSNFLGGTGSGAWEGAARYSYLDLDAEGDLVGSGANGLHDFTVGLNWYWNPVFRVMLNYVWAHAEGAGDLQIAEMRFSIGM